MLNYDFLDKTVLRPHLTEDVKKSTLKAADHYARTYSLDKTQNATGTFFYNLHHGLLHNCDEVQFSTDQLTNLITDLSKRNTTPYNYVKTLKKIPLPNFEFSNNDLYSDTKIVFRSDCIEQKRILEKPTDNLTISSDFAIDVYVFFTDGFSYDFFVNHDSIEPDHALRISRLTATTGDGGVIFSKVHTVYVPTQRFTPAYGRDGLFMRYENVQRIGIEFLAFYLAVQHAFNTKPEVFHDNVIWRSSIPMSNSNETQPDKEPKMNSVEIVSNSYPENDNASHSNRTYICECWGVSGHPRRLKSGKVTFVRPYKKGRKRNDPTAYSPKSYKMADS